MDFERLRAEGIRHLETLATHIWTDFNAHDPGITILEVLCYALTDLGYRIDLPLEDLLAATPNSDQKVFFPADEVLSSCPITEIDFRKLIIDISGVKNAWLSKAQGEYPMYFSESTATYYPSNEGKQEDSCTFYPLNHGEKQGTNINLNGLYKVILELHDHGLEPYHNTAKKIIAEVKHRLYANRNLCEDFVEVCLIEKQEICLCLNLEIEPHADAEETMAKALFELQEFLTPTIKFHNLQQLLEKGFSGDEIYDGPILQNGFIDDKELQKAQIPKVIQLSDLYSVLENIPEILTVKEIKFLVNGAISEEWCLNNNDKKKPVINPCCSCLYISQNGQSTEIKGENLEELIAFNNLVNQDLPESEISALDYPKGDYRQDLAEYTPIQYEFPRTYYLGKNGLPDSASTKRKAQSDQLKAYLLFFDRILANYLQKLSKVRDIFSMSQDIDSSLVFFQTLEHVPGMQTLIFTLTPEKSELLKSAIPSDWFEEEDMKSILDEIDGLVGKVLDNKDNLEEYLASWIEKLKNDSHSEAFAKKVEQMLDRATIGPKAYEKALEKIALGEDSQAERKDEIFDHLLARFGEQFTTYTLNLFKTSETAKQENFSDYLEAKSAYLSHLPTLSAGRAKAYNYKLLKENNQAPDEWNTYNVSGLKKRICALLGMNAEESSVFCDPDYRVNLKKDTNKRGAYYYLELVALSDEVDPRTGSRKAKDILMTSADSYRKKVAEKLEATLYENLGTYDGFSDPTAIKKNEEGLLKFSISTGNHELVMQSGLLTKAGAIQCLEDIKSLLETADCEKEAFHILEHILLRSNDDKDDLLQAPAFCGKDALKIDPYSFWISVVLPGWVQRFEDASYRRFFEQTFLRETPAHIAVCFRWVEKENKQKMKGFEHAFETWKETKAKCPTDECKMTIEANELIDKLAAIPCPCLCNDKEGLNSKCAKPESKIDKNEGS